MLIVLSDKGVEAQQVDVVAMIIPSSSRYWGFVPPAAFEATRVFAPRSFITRKAVPAPIEATRLLQIE